MLTWFSLWLNYDRHEPARRRGDFSYELRSCMVRFVGRWYFRVRDLNPSRIAERKRCYRAALRVNVALRR